MQITINRFCTINGHFWEYLFLNRIFVCHKELAQVYLQLEKKKIDLHYNTREQDD